MKVNRDSIQRKYDQNVPKLLIAFMIMILLIGTKTHAQGLSTYNPQRSSTRGIELGGFYGWQFGGSLSAVQGDISIKDSDFWGLALDIPIPAGVQVELLYHRQDSKLELKQRGTNVKEPLFDMSVEYFQIGGLRGLPKGNTLPYGIFTLGATRFHPKDPSYNDEWKFSATLGLGVKVYASERVGLRLQGNLLIPFQWSGGSLWCGTSGCSVGVSSGSAIIQGNVLGGLFIVF